LPLGVFALSLCGFALVQLALYRPKSKESSAFPKSYPLRKRAIGGEMRLLYRIRDGKLVKTTSKSDWAANEY
jgi:hypothetical protein